MYNVTLAHGPDRNIDERTCRLADPMTTSLDGIRSVESVESVERADLPHFGSLNLKSPAKRGVIQFCDAGEMITPPSRSTGMTKFRLLMFRLSNVAPGSDTTPLPLFPN